MSALMESTLSSKRTGKNSVKVADSGYGWSKWIWDEKVYRYYRARRSENGQYLYEYDLGSQLSAETTSRVKQEEPTELTTIAETYSGQDKNSYQNEAVPPTSLDECGTESFYPASQSIPIPSTSLDEDEINPFLKTPVTPQPLPLPSTSLDERYQIISYPSRFFKIGRVFKLLWTEPAGSISDSNYEFVIPAKFGEMAFTKIRPFVVIREMQRCCLCLPLNTFSHQGTEKDRIRAEDYAAVYPMGGELQIGAFEKMIKQPFPIIIEDPKERIDPMSRLNFGQVHTVQHNLKVLRIGRIPDEYLALLNKYFLETIAGTPAQDTTGVSMAFGSLSLGLDEKASSSQGAREDVGELATTYGSSSNFALHYGPGRLLLNSYLGTDPVPQNTHSSPSTKGVVVSSGCYIPEISNTSLANSHYQTNPTAYDRQLSASDAQIPIPDTAKMIRRTPDDTEKLDPSFQIHKSKDFRPGRVFKVLWSEPGGGDGSDITSVSSFSRKAQKGVYTSVRRFVIVAADHGHSQCLPILTYSGKATTKVGVHGDDHAIIYTGDKPPKELPGESQLRLRPIQVIPRMPRDKLAHGSRINYAKIYTVEHNVKVAFIGNVANSSQLHFVADFDAIWLRKRQMDPSPKS